MVEVESRTRGVARAVYYLVLSSQSELVDSLRLVMSTQAKPYSTVSLTDFPQATAHASGHFVINSLLRPQPTVTQPQHHPTDYQPNSPPSDFPESESEQKSSLV